MNKVVKRLLIFFIGLPAVLGVIAFPFPNDRYLLVNIVIMIASGLGALETANLFKKKGAQLHPVLAFSLGIIFPLFTYLELMGITSRHVLMAVLTIGVTLIFSSQVIGKSNEDFKPVISRIGGYLTSLFYPGLFFAYTTRLSLTNLVDQSYPYSPYPLLIFILMTYGNDSMAWFFGVLFGKKSRGLIAVSPNKSLVGFLGGLFSSCVVGLLIYLVIPDLSITKLPIVLLWGFLTGIMTILGDLIESAIKRSASVKDSGDIIPGRGGLLDSIDSLLFAAPVYYYLLIWILY
ncbi:phosphatidate cytidylyltransferase [Spirochaeta cellobiosiphila]|uniref:phosphatidate cytidylyltransferase n=1 Tax=Spirochaeta cellobiosiphila TaxID=504483 RepID=UPI00048C5BC8|nr:phosphatidate cytidylyltransferase [Spirochaeta cellobiosiphila]